MTEQIAKKKGRPTLNKDGIKMAARCNVVLTDEEKGKLSAIAEYDFGIPLSRFMLLASQVVKKGLLENNPEILRLCSDVGLVKLGYSKADNQLKTKTAASRQNRANARVSEIGKFTRVEKKLLGAGH